MEEHSATNSCAKGMTPESDEARGQLSTEKTYKGQSTVSCTKGL